MQRKSQQNLFRNAICAPRSSEAIASLFILQALFIGINGNHDILSGKSPLDVIPWMLTQSIELLIKVQGLQDKDKDKQ
ncbi:MAG: hypothetical protein VKL59_01130 [Nostocaceae cyanobacterium]|nr:hypothetical protein [Nostocaceae cyanobacterium]